VIIAGGSQGASASRAILSFDPAAGTVAQIGELPAAVAHASAATFGSTVYVIGGRGASADSQTADVIAIDPGIGRARLVARLPRPVSDSAAVTTAAGVVVAGGRTTAGPQASVNELQVSTRG
jgi:N-acetylneuraminic acid mutarotase